MLVPSVAALAQAEASFVTVTGVVKDENTRKEVPFASISIPGTHIGTVANADGEFTLKVLKSLNATDFEVTHIGYLNKRFNIEEALKNGKTYYIAPHSVPLKEVVVRPEDPESIIRGALTNVKKNYSEIPNILVGFTESLLSRNATMFPFPKRLLMCTKALTRRSLITTV